MRQNTETIARVYAYGCGDPTSDPNVLAELSRQHDLWDALVAIDREHERRRDEAARAAHPVYAELRERIDALSEQIGALIQERRDARKRARKKVDTPEIDARLDELVPQRRALWKEAKAALKEWAREHKETVRDLEQQRKDEVKAARQASPAWWPNYNRVIDDYNAARKTVRMKGRGLRPVDRAREDGVLTVQIQRTKSGLGAAPHELMDGTVPNVQIAPVPDTAHGLNTPRGERKRQCRTRVTMRVDAAGHKVTLPVTLHRPIPADGRVKSVQLAWKREGERIRARLCLTVSTPKREAIPHPSRSACGVDIGWRLERDRSLRVVTVYDSAGGVEHVRLPRDWMAGMDRVERLHTYIDDGLMELAEALHGRDDLPAPVASALDGWRPGLGARHVDARALHDYIRPLRDERKKLPAELLHWYNRYRHLLLYRDNLRNKLIRRRKDLYRVAAKRLAQTYSVIAIEDFDLSAVARTKKREDGSDPELHAAARAQRVRACVHEFRSILQDMAAKHGAEVMVIAGPSTQLCHHCGNKTGQIDRSRLHWQCESCHAVWDQDENAARNLLYASTGASDAVLTAV